MASDLVVMFLLNTKCNIHKGSAIIKVDRYEPKRLPFDEVSIMARMSIKRMKLELRTIIVFVNI